MLPDLVWISTPGENEELRYSMRSLTANLPHGKVWLVTAKAPSWHTGGIVDPGDLTDSPFLNCQNAYRVACADLRISDPFILADDDEYLLHPIPELRPTHRGLLADVHSEPPYDTRAYDTASILEDLGIDRPLSYDKHMPILVHKATMIEALQIAETQPPDIWIESLYGNLAHLGGTFHHDPKAYGPHATRIEREPGQEHQGDWLSTDEESWQGAAGALVRSLFTSPSEVENPTAPDVRPYVLSIHAGADTGGVSCGMANAFQNDPTIHLRSAVLNQNYIKYPYDLQLGARFYPDVFDHWQAADVVHIHNNRRTYDHLVNKCAQPHRPFVMYHHGTEYREYIDERNAEVANHPAGARAVVSTIDMLGLGPDLMWAPATYRLGDLARYRDRQYGHRLRVGHAPTDRAIKSTGAFLNACRTLNVEPVLIEKTDWENCQKIKGTVDLFFDQVLLGYGCNAIEAWGMGIPVIAGGPPRTLEMMRSAFGGTLPFFEATEDTIGDAIQALMDPDTRDEYAALGLDHVRRFHSGAYTRAILTPIYQELATKNVKPEPARDPVSTSQPQPEGSPDLVWIVRPGDNEELRYSIRSVTANLPHRNVWVIGEPPDWYTGNVIHNKPTAANQFVHTKTAIRKAVNDLRISDPFIMLNDDFYLTEQLDKLPTMHGGPLNPAKPEVNTRRTAAKIDTLALLTKAGIRDPLSYDSTHTPLLVSKATMAKALDLIDKTGNPALWERTVYGNLAELGGIQVPDCKVRTPGQAIPDGPWVSSSDKTFTTSILPVLAPKFPKASAYCTSKT